jgi:hypothetical protein
MRGRGNAGVGVLLLSERLPEDNYFAVWSAQNGRLAPQGGDN